MSRRARAIEVTEKGMSSAARVTRTARDEATALARGGEIVTTTGTIGTAAQGLETRREPRDHRARTTQGRLSQRWEARPWRLWGRSPTSFLRAPRSSTTHHA